MQKQPVKGQQSRIFRSSEVSRRHFMKASSLGAMAAWGGVACAAETEEPVNEAAPTAFFKDTTPFAQHGQTNLESKIESLGGFITPNDLFFVRNNSRSVKLDAASYMLEITGEAVSNPLSISYAELMNMPSRSVYAYLECGGNQRSFFGTAMGQPARGTQWGRGGVGMAIWTGVPLHLILEKAGIQDSAVDVQLVGLDMDSPEGGFRRPVPINKAIDEDTILAYRMNGDVLPIDHGFPVRAIVPGWVGSTSIKWLGRIEVSSQRVWSRNNTSSYVLIGDDYPPDGEASGVVATTQSIKSILLLPWPASVSAGRQMIRGYAYSPHAPVSQVVWSSDGGGQWSPAQFVDPPIKYAWRRFEFEWSPQPGEHTLITRATDEAGNTQPDAIPFNEKGYLYNVPLIHPVQAG